MSHWVEVIRGYQALQQYSGERHENVHETNLKDGSWNLSNYNLNYLTHVITFQHCILCFTIRDLILQALTQHRENSTATCTILSSGADLAALLSSQTYAKPEFMGPQNRRDGKHSDAMIQYFRALHDNTQNAMHCLTLYHGTREFIKQRVATRCLYRTNNCMQWRSESTMVFRFKLLV